jgi:hypothetical protein
VYTLNEICRYREKYGKKKLILDTNLLLLLLIGGYDKSCLDKYQCTEKYTGNDYVLLLKVLNFFKSEIVITPQILAEFSNQTIRDIKNPKIHHFIMMVRDKLRQYKEEYVPLDKLLDIEVKTIVIFGFPDMSIIEAASKIDAVILTDEINLCDHANFKRIPNIRFSALRAANTLIT